VTDLLGQGDGGALVDSQHAKRPSRSVGDLAN
jgi:hypothetical protein